MVDPSDKSPRRRDAPLQGMTSHSKRRVGVLEAVRRDTVDLVERIFDIEGRENLSGAQIVRS